MQPSTSKSHASTVNARKRHAKKVVAELKRLYPDARCGLDFKNPFQLLVATILSAQCTDKRVNMITPSLFARYPDACALASAVTDELEAIIRSAGFFRAKAKSLLGMAAGLVERHAGEVPADLLCLIKLPGVGRKTANVVIGTAFDHPSGVVVDTHVKRLSFRLGLTDRQEPVKIERDLSASLPRSEWIMFSHRIIQHGRRICLARKPRCSACGLEPICPRAGVKNSA